MAEDKIEKEKTKKSVRGNERERDKREEVIQTQGERERKRRDKQRGKTQREKTNERKMFTCLIFFETFPILLRHLRRYLRLTKLQLEPPAKKLMQFVR